LAHKHPKKNWARVNPGGFVKVPQDEKSALVLHLGE